MMHGENSPLDEKISTKSTDELALNPDFSFSLATPTEQTQANLAQQSMKAAFIINEQCCIFTIALFTPITYLLDEDATEAAYTADFIGCLLSILASSGWLMFEKKLSVTIRDSIKTKKINYWANRAKTCFILGSKIGEMIGYFLPVPIIMGRNIAQRIVCEITSALLGIVFGLCGILFFDGDLNERTQKLLTIGRESWTKYCKAGAVGGNCVGSLIGAALGTFLFPGLGSFIGFAIGGVSGSILGFLCAAGGVPLIKALQLRLKRNKPNKPSVAKYSSNYFRAGLTLGSNLGTLIGALLGAFLLPGLGIALGALVGGSIGGIIGGLALALTGPAISRYAAENSKSATSFDYSLRTGAMFGGKKGIGQAISPAMGELAPAAPAAGSFLFGLIGGIQEIVHSRKKAKKPPCEDKFILPWTQNAATGIVIGSFCGGFIGYLIFPPLGGIIGSGLGGFIFGIASLAITPFLLRKLNNPQTGSTEALVIPSTKQVEADNACNRQMLQALSAISQTTYTSSSLTNTLTPTIMKEKKEEKKNWKQLASCSKDNISPMRQNTFFNRRDVVQNMIELRHYPLYHQSSMHARLSQVEQKRCTGHVNNFDLSN